jgi:hypothetical protein
LYYHAVKNETGVEPVTIRRLLAFRSTHGVRRSVELDEGQMPADHRKQ